MYVDITETVGKYLECIEGCALCCLCQPELVGEENFTFSGDPLLSKALVGRSITGTVTGSYFLKLKGGAGSCHFLDDRRCTIYERRPIYCRMFPVHVHVGDRVQINVNLSCRGVNGKGRGTDMTELAEHAIAMADYMGLQEISREISVTYDDFCASLPTGSEWLTRNALVQLSLDLLSEHGFPRFIERLASLPSMGQGSLSGPGNVRKAMVEAVPLDLTGSALDGARDTFSLRKVSDLPVWTDEEMNWIVCRIVGKHIEVNRLSDTGGLELRSRFPLSDISLLEPDPEGRMVMEDHCRRLIERDLTYGYAAFVCRSDPEGDVKDFPEYYFGCLATLFTDLWWRTSLAAAFRGCERIDDSTAMDGIRAFDMDFLDLPSLGGFL